MLEEILESSLNIEVCVVFYRIGAGSGPCRSSCRHQGESDQGSWGANPGDRLEPSFCFILTRAHVHVLSFMYRLWLHTSALVMEARTDNEEGPLGKRCFIGGSLWD